MKLLHLVFHKLISLWYGKRIVHKLGNYTLKHPYNFISIRMITVNFIVTTAPKRKIGIVFVSIFHLEDMVTTSISWWVWITL